MDDSVRLILQKRGIGKFRDIQKRVFPEILAGRDVFLLASTGSGKTVAFGAPVVSRLYRKDARAALVLAPTRELSHQIACFFMPFGELGLQVVHVVGGEDFEAQREALAKEPRLVVATPGRMAEHLRRGFSGRSFDILVVDEVDKLLEMNFREDMEYIGLCLAEKRQNILASATCSDLAAECVASSFGEIKYVVPGDGDAKNLHVLHKFVLCPLKYKEVYLLHLVRHFSSGRTIVFFSSCFKVVLFAEIFKLLGIRVSRIHGRMDHGERRQCIRDSAGTRTVFATDVAARGLNLNVDCVINYDMPRGSEVYVHRAGRTGRNSSEGTVVSIATEADADHILRTERAVSVVLERMAIAREDVLGECALVQETKFRAHETVRNTGFCSGGKRRGSR